VTLKPSKDVKKPMSIKLNSTISIGFWPIVGRCANYGCLLSLVDQRETKIERSKLKQSENLKTWWLYILSIIDLYTLRVLKFVILYHYLYFSVNHAR